MNYLIPMMADVSVNGSGGLMQNLLLFLLVGVCLAAIWAVGNWLLGKFKAPEIASTLWMVIFVLLALIVFVNFCMSLAGKPFLKWS